MKKRKIKILSGQTLLEAILAIGIIIMVIMAFLSRTISFSSYQKQSFRREQALFLAKENIEIARNIRDSNWLKGCASLTDSENCFYWDSGISPAGRYVIDYDENKEGFFLNELSADFSQCLVDQSCRVFIDANGRYVNNGGSEPTEFYRALELRPICKNNQECQNGVCFSGQTCQSKIIGMEIFSFVKWWERDFWRTVELTEQIYDWR